jgi:hypothetical protein
MSLIIFLFIIAVVIALFSFTGQKPQSFPPVFPPVIAPLPEPEYVPVPGEIIPGVETVNGVELNPVPVVDPVPIVDPVPATEICPVPAEVESVPVEVELFPVSQSLSEEVLSPLPVYPTLGAVVAEEFQINETQVPKKKHYYYKPKSKK